jgi:hypothetical protein
LITIFEKKRTIFEKKRTIFEKKRTIFKKKRTIFEKKRTIFEKNQMRIIYNSQSFHRFFYTLPHDFQSEIVKFDFHQPNQRQ